MKILVLGSNGYIGNALCWYLKRNGHEVRGIDNGSRERNVRIIGGKSLTPVKPYPADNLDIRDSVFLCDTLRMFEPDTIVHLAEQPSAPFSMRDLWSAEETQRNNIIGTLSLIWAVADIVPNAHIIKLGTMGVYGTPNEDIEEHNGPVAFDPGSFYHISKACDSMNLRKACEWKGLNVTDLHQGVVYGHIDGTRFDYDSYFGTVINRFIAQALIGHPLTVYGSGGQTRGYININDTMRCIELAAKNPPDGYRVFNQLTDIMSVRYLAGAVSNVCIEKGIDVSIDSVDNPRLEAESHYYNPTHKGLLELGLSPHDFETELSKTVESLLPYQSLIIKEVVMPKTKWHQG